MPSTITYPRTLSLAQPEEACFFFELGNRCAVRNEKALKLLATIVQDTYSEGTMDDSYPLAKEIIDEYASGNANKLVRYALDMAQSAQCRYNSFFDKHFKVHPEDRTDPKQRMRDNTVSILDELLA